MMLPGFPGVLLFAFMLTCSQLNRFLSACGGRSVG